jgi:deazaflavin-dependent oxidoreductase (nitroreductase family)
MNENGHVPKLPKGFSRFLYRLPILLYRIGLGGLLGKRFLLLEHIGRRSGLIREAVLEVIRYDETQNVFYIVSAFGERSDWYQNIVKNPDVRIQVGRKWWMAYAQVLTSDLSEKEILSYAERNPRIFRALAERLLGYEVGESDQDLIHLARQFIVVSIGVKSGDGENGEEMSNE